MTRKPTMDRTQESAVGHNPAEVDDEELVVALVDDALRDFAGRELLSGGEVVDRLLDLRGALLAAIEIRNLDDEPVPVG